MTLIAMTVLILACRFQSSGVHRTITWTASIESCSTHQRVWQKKAFNSDQLYRPLVIDITVKLNVCCLLYNMMPIDIDHKFCQEQRTKWYRVASDINAIILTKWRTLVRYYAVACLKPY